MQIMVDWTYRVSPCKRESMFRRHLQTSPPMKNGLLYNGNSRFLPHMLTPVYPITRHHITGVKIHFTTLDRVAKFSIIRHAKVGGELPTDTGKTVSAFFLSLYFNLITIWDMECVCVCMYVCTYVCMYVCRYVRTYVCM